MPDPEIRPARPDEAAAMTALMRRSKQHWGYDAAFMEAHAGSLTITREDIERWGSFVLVLGGTLIGLLHLEAGSEPEVMVLTDLFIDPAFIGKGNGTRLWNYACGVARERGFRVLTFDSDPNAVGFYLHLGAIQIGVTRSTVIPGRVLPAMRFDLVD